MSKEIVVVFGSRNWRNKKAIRDYIYSLPSDVKVISGGGGNADKLAELFCRVRGLEFECFPADWKRFGRSAGPIRDKQMAEAATRGHAFWDGKSKGTAHTIRFLKELGKPCEITYEVQS